MYIKSIHLDGFKSYQKHTEILGFSDKFNAITGYNGSGKSNVLDSICFILGISKLDNIRAKSMADLVSHGGTKATVQIRFDNREKAFSPYGMDHLDEIVVQRTITVMAAGKGCATSYTLNGHAATNGKIHDFFRSIGLNVNNPHFLIMQGRITTVLNMKPEEILGMLEEAAGTKMYDQKRKDAEKTIFLKDVKMKEVEKMFSDIINPRMEKFREDRKNMVEVTRLTKLKENASRKHEAFQYFQTLENAKRDKENMESVKTEIEDLEKRITEIQEEGVRKQDEKKQLEDARADKDQEEALHEAQKEKINVKMKFEQDRSAITEGINRAKKDQERISKSLVKDRKILDAKRKELTDIRDGREDEINGYKEDEAEVQKLRDDLESLTRGTVANEKGQHVSIEHEIQECRSKSAQLDAGIRTASNRRDRLCPRIDQLLKEHAEVANKDSSEIEKVQNSTQEISKIKARIETLGFDAEEEKSLRERENWLLTEIRNIDEANRKLTAEQCRGAYQLNYTPPPVADFDGRRDILGFIAHLIFMKPGTEKYATAVETAVGGFLNQIVVRNQEVARILIDSRAFNQRRTLIPVSENDRVGKNLNVLSEQALKNAKDKASEYGEECTRLIDVVDFPDCISNTVKSYIGNILCVETLRCARAVAYDKGVKTRTVTLRGDDVKPNGVMSGGYSDNQGHSTLLALEPMKERRVQLDQYWDELTPLQNKLKSIEIPAKQYNDLNNELISAQRQLAQCKSNMKNSTLGVVQKDLDEAKKALEDVEIEIEKNSKILVELQEKVKTLEMMKNNDKNSQEKRKKELQALLSKAEKKVTQNKDKAEMAKREVMQIAAAVDSLEASIKTDENELQSKKDEYEKLLEMLPGAETALAEAAAEEAAASQAVDDLRNAVRQRSGRLAKVTKEIDMLRKEETKAKGKKEEREKESTRLYESEKANLKHARATLKKREWLEDAQVHFNKKGNLYDFDGYTIQKGTVEIKELSDKIDKLERCLCMKNVSNLDVIEAKVIDINNKREQVTGEFDMIKKTISYLDKKKVEVLRRAHKSVNDDFDKIFNCLLPDANANLVAPEGKTVCDGLEVKVSFNGVVKDSLHELSGGQRSLVALSLILAMLKFNPAPLYILDEVDAALDLSHTANIGMMIRSHFRNSQFIIVSLKQGMFSNADTLFQTSFADGHSTCTRLTGAAYEMVKNDKKLAKQADEITADSQEPKKKKAKGNEASKTAKSG